MSITNLQQRLHERLNARAKNVIDLEKPMQPMQPLRLQNAPGAAGETTYLNTQKTGERKPSKKRIGCIGCIGLDNSDIEKPSVGDSTTYDTKTQRLHRLHRFSELTHIHTRTRAHAPAHACGAKPMQPMQPLHELKPAKCSMCLKFSRVGETCYCYDYIGGSGVVWGTGERICTPTPDEDHWCVGFRNQRA